MSETGESRSMNAAEQTILKRAKKDLDKLTVTEKQLVERLDGYSENYRLNRRTREQLYAIGHKFGINGRQLFIDECLKKSEDQLKRGKSL